MQEGCDWVIGVVELWRTEANNAEEAIIADGIEEFR